MRVNVSLHEILSSTQTIFDQVKKKCPQWLHVFRETENIHQE